MHLFPSTTALGLTWPGLNKPPAGWDASYESALYCSENAVPLAEVVPDELGESPDDSEQSRESGELGNGKDVRNGVPFIPWNRVFFWGEALVALVDLEPEA